MTDHLLAHRPSLTADIALRLRDTAREAILSRGFSMFVAIVDAAAVPLVVERINDAQPASFDVALAKARAAVGFRRPTKAFEDRVLTDHRVNLVTLPGIVAVEGGVPLVVAGQVVGAIGVSGGTGVEDGEIAAVALSSFHELVSAR
jgi:glc operon protein GlcG